MSKNFLIAFGIGIVCIAMAAMWVVHINRGAYIDLPGKVLKVRTAPLDEASAVAVLDFRVSNPADYPFVVRKVTVAMEDNSGAESEGQTGGTDAATRRDGAGCHRPHHQHPLLGAGHRL